MGKAIDANDAISIYKLILREVLDKRPAGLRRKLADMLGKSRSFITHLSNPIYSTPIPVQYIGSILAICHFSQPEREAFLSAYEKAHPGKIQRPTQDARLRTVHLRLPDLHDTDLNLQLDRMIQETVVRLIHIVQSSKAQRSFTKKLFEGASQ